MTLKLEELNIYIPETCNYFQKKVSPTGLYLSLIFFPQTRQEEYKPLIDYVHGIANSAFINYNGIAQTTDEKRKIIYSSLYLFDILAALLNDFIFSLRLWQQPSQIFDALETLYERIEIIRPYADQFMTSDINILAASKLPENVEREITHRIILFHKLMKMFSKDRFKITPIPIQDLSFHKLASRYLSDLSHYNTLDAHILCKPKYVFDRMNETIDLLKENSEFEVYRNHCLSHVSKFLQNIAHLYTYKRQYLTFFDTLPKQPPDGYFIEERMSPYKLEQQKYIHSPEFAPSFKFFSPNVEEYNLLPFLVCSLAPQNHINVFSAPFLYLSDHNSGFSFFISGLIESILPDLSEKNPTLHHKNFMELSEHSKFKIKKLYELKKVSQLFSYEITVALNKFLFANTPSEYRRCQLGLLETCNSLMVTFSAYNMTVSEFNECDFDEYEEECITSFYETIVRFSQYIKLTQEDIHANSFQTVPYLTEEEMAYWNFTRLCLTLDLENVEIPVGYAIQSVSEFCDHFKHSFQTFHIALAIADGEHELLIESIREQCTRVIAYYCKYYDETGFFHSMFNITKQHFFLEDHSKKSISEKMRIKAEEKAKEDEANKLNAEKKTLEAEDNSDKAEDNPKPKVYKQAYIPPFFNEEKKKKGKDDPDALDLLFG